LATGSLALVLLFAVLGLTAGCTLLRFGKGGAGKPSAQPELVDEQIQLQRFADDFQTRTGQALDESAERLDTDAGRQKVLRLKLTIGSSVLSVVSGPNPNANLLDLVSLTVLMRMSVQDYWMKTTNGAAFRPWLDVSRALERDVWDLAGRFLKPAQVDELRRGIEQWYAQNPEVRTAFFARPHAFASMVWTSQEKGAGSTFNLVSLDPTAGLEPAVREVTQSRLFAERAMYLAQRMPFYLRFQAELLAYEVTEQPASQMALSNATQLTESARHIGHAAESLSQTARQLPDLLAGADRALTSGEKMAGSLNITVTNLDALVQRLKSERTNARPFDILDYAQTADKVDNVARDLNALVGSVNQGVPEIQRLSRQADADLQKDIDRGFRLGLVLIAVLLTGSLLVGVLCIYFAQKLKQRHAAGAGG
jgi:hypothetical protein